MHTKTSPAPALLEDLESIRALLDENIEPPLLTNTVESTGPCVLSVVQASEEAKEARPSPARTAFRDLAERHIDHELRVSAQSILQEVIDEFIPQIEAELKRRLEPTIERLVRPGQL
ncbi:DNA polymerase III subunit chi [Stutzerimonas kirkiae]|uniref:DNA polymerase III subunit chi n=1 Tax=Stutzerimonas kirkiae TaxID=2211392 RepID=A0A4V6MXE0_9GAMM|nr:DNA polymerase III subunit chi [Stutzerimonas kirkiae]TBU99769.1 DNA polymerase III subunit chi [Stutzerimonas kirkiae]TBV05299.1 DNA polymerase III subunit chi [Stutzerimonas kirkiae]TBV11733.1 DNA polymerase III subunit chi [Stutzerimonas kirkiae]TBV15338.1 DNA polymerase III subunit chi [Stutzerimonas kirkiae]